ncbi:MAG: hypothetical protein EAZ06_03855 [Cytophagales bacterium]|nr:MAG: hypothetical protein EAY69_10130 [Cytophagales bacterium]TAH30256.1 MAG: hypothetical protein EAZ06_03855 [Cytophagales bacterium]
MLKAKCILFLIFIFIFEIKAETNKTISVKNTEEFLKAIGNDITIRITTNRLDFSDLPTINNTNITLIPKNEGVMLQIQNVKNLRIIGQKNNTKIISTLRYCYILSFKDVENIIIENIEAGHGLYKSIEEGGVFLFENSKNINITNCTLFGGTDGITLNKVNNFEFKNSIIRGCVSRIMTIQNSKNINFFRSRFTENKELDLFYIVDSEDIEFDKCVIDLNRSGRGETYDNYAMFHVPKEPGNFSVIITLKECKIEDNFNQFFCRIKEIIKLEKCVMENNFFEKGYNSVEF